MGNNSDSPGLIVQEWIKLRFHLRPFAENMGKNHGTLYNWLKGEKIKKKNLIAIVDNAIDMGASPVEIGELLKEIGEKPESFNLNKIESTTIKGKNISAGNQTITTGISTEEYQDLRNKLREKDNKITTLEGQLKAYKEIINQLTNKDSS